MCKTSSHPELSSERSSNGNRNPRRQDHLVSHLATGHGVVHGDSGGFEAVVAEAAALCPVSRLFSGAEVTVSSHLIEG
ncbi:MAG: hypothetical protein H0X42_04535 [Solirubrobacterales bacterium]|nr:hypothetical protein [Solirubrobacterales bacterium]